MRDDYMKTVSIRKIFILEMLILFLILTSAVMVSAQSVKVYDDNVITGFEQADYNQIITTDYKYALIELEKEFPQQIAVQMGGNVLYQTDENGRQILVNVSDFTIRTLNITWKCLENYDDKLDVYHFIPVLDEYELTENLDLPVITVNVSYTLQIPPLTYMPQKHLSQTDFNKVEKTVSKGILPSSYNAYSDGTLPSNLPPLRNQSPYGTCWAFAAVAAVEADMIHDGTADASIDLSELHLAYFTNNDFYDEKNANSGDTVTLRGVSYLDMGGDSFIGGMTMSNMLGPVQESRVPYNQASGYAPNPDAGRIGDVQVTGFYVLHDSEAIKNAILEHGAVAAAYCDASDSYGNSQYFSDTYHSYYCSESYTTNHAVALVGWDDNFSRNHFTSTPEGDGAWLVRNSWGGNGYGHRGYFWISYYDKSLYEETYAADAQPWRYDHVYAYDNSPWHYNYPFPPNVTASQAFQVDGGEMIKAIGFYTDDTRVGYRFSVSSGNKTVTKEIKFKTPGYNLFTLPEPLIISGSSDVTVEISFIYDDSITYVELSYEDDYTMYSYDQTSDVMGQVQFTSQSGTGMVINDGEIYQNFKLAHDAKIKLFTNDIYDLVLPENLTTIGSEAFVGGKFKTVRLSGNTVSIGSRAFADCPNLTKIYIPSATTQIDNNAFGGKTNFTIVGVGGSTAESFASAHGIVFQPVS